MGLLERAYATWTELQGVGRLLPGLPALNPFGHRSCAQLLQQRATDAPHQVGLAFQHDRWTWQEIHRRANQYANFGVRERLQRGDVVALLMDSRPDYLFIGSGLNRIGVVSALINTHLTDAALVHAITVAKPKALLVGSEHLPAVDAVLHKLPGLSKRNNVWVQLDPDRTAGCPGFRVINPDVAACSTEEPRRGLPETTAPMCYVYTSGTTGLPKAAIIRNLRWLEAGLILSRVVGEMTPRDVLYLTLPLYHSAGFLAAWGAVLLSGAVRRSIVRLPRVFTECLRPVSPCFEYVRRRM